MILDRYIARAVATTTVIVLTVLLALFAFGNLVAELEDVGQGRYSFFQAALYVAITLLPTAYQLLPASALLGTMLGLGTLAAQNELTVMRAAGVSLNRISWAVMKVGVVLMLVALLVGELLAPPTQRYAETMRQQALAEGVSVTAESGVWARADNDFVHIRDVLTDGRLGGVTLYRFDDEHRLQEVLHARTAHYRDQAWWLETVERSQITRDGVETEELSGLRWEPLLSPEVLTVVAVKPESLSLWGLADYIGYLRSNGLDAARYQLAFWNKVVSPLATGVMVFLAIPVVFGPLRSVSVGQRVMVGTLVGFGFHLLNKAFGYIGLVYELPPLLSAVLPTLLFFGAGLWYMRRVQ